MTGLGTYLQVDAAHLIAEAGYDLTLRRIVRGAYDPATGSAATSSNDDETVKGLFINYSESDIDGTNVQRGDRRAIITAPTTKAPQINDELRGEADAVRIVSAQTIKSGAAVVAYICQVRE